MKWGVDILLIFFILYFEVEHSQGNGLLAAAGGRNDSRLL
jgi:hypothetical protein